MKSFFVWSAAIAGIAVGGVVAWNLVQAGRAKLRDALARAEQIADSSRRTLEQTQATLHQARTSV